MLNSIKQNTKIQDFKQFNNKLITPNKCNINHSQVEKSILTPANLQGFYLVKLNKTPALSFGHRWNDHTSYGLTFDYDKNNNVKPGANAKIFTYPDAKKVEVEVAKDPSAKFVKNYKNEADSDKIKSFALENKGNGVFMASGLDISPGDRYRYKLTLANGETRHISDLYSYNQKSCKGWPVAYDQKAYDRSDEGLVLRKHTQDWNNGIVAGKVNNIKSQNDPNFVPSMGMRMMQMHLGTFSKEGNFEGAVKKLDDIQEMGFNTVELLPHGYFDDVNWGYDPSFVFASQYGGNDKFKKFCDEAHKRELNVVVDVVNNHYSADNKEILKEAGPYSSPHHEHDFGPCPNFTDTEKSNRDAVRDWRINESLYWLANGADGIRYDLSDWTMSPEFNLQLNAEIQEHFPGAPTFAESPEYNSSRPLPDGAINKATGADKENAHLEITKKAQNNEFGSEKEGFTHRWHFDWSHALEKTILHPFDRDVEGLKSQVYDAQNQTKIMFSHDEIGKQEADGNDLTVKVMVGKLFGSDIGDLGWGAERNKQEKYWKASRAVRELTRAYVTGDEWPSNEKQLAKEVGKYGGDVNDHKSDSYGLPDYEKGGLGLADLGWQHGISKKEFGNLFNTAFETDKAAMGFLFSQPGPKMVFQSFDKSDRRFSFFRQGFEVNKDVDRQKGHVIDSQDIIDQAKIDKLNGEYSETALKYQKNMKKLVKALNKLGAENPALQDGEVKDVIGNHNDAISVYSKKGNNEIYSVTNFGDHKNYGSNDKYKIYFPEGTWKEVLNTNAKEFGGSGKYANVVVSGGKEADINLPKASTLIFKRVG